MRSAIEHRNYSRLFPALYHNFHKIPNCTFNFCHCPIDIIHRWRVKQNYPLLRSVRGFREVFFYALRCACFQFLQSLDLHRRDRLRNYEGSAQPRFMFSQICFVQNWHSRAKRRSPVSTLAPLRRSALVSRFGITVHSHLAHLADPPLWRFHRKLHERAVLTFTLRALSPPLQRLQCEVEGSWTAAAQRDSTNSVYHAIFDKQPTCVSDQKKTSITCLQRSQTWV